MISGKEGELGAALFLILVLSFFGSLSFNTTVALEVLRLNKRSEGQTLALFSESYSGRNVGHVDLLMPGEMNLHRVRT